MKSNDLETGYTAVDMTTAAAQGFRDGVASAVVKLAGIPDAWACDDHEKKFIQMGIDLAAQAISAAGVSVE